MKIWMYSRGTEFNNKIQSLKGVKCVWLFVFFFWLFAFVLKKMFAWKLEMSCADLEKTEI